MSGNDTALAVQLKRRIAAQGPITVAEYMAEVLTNPVSGYYTTRDPLGARGDFVTAPEVSQMFGELLGLWCAETWQRLGVPRPVRLVELGPGRGTLMADALRAAKVLPAFLEAVEVHLVEISPALRAKQKETLADTAVTWHGEVATLPEGPLLVLANEFFDALPVRQFVRTPKGWCERLVGFDPAEDRFVFALGPPDLRAAAYVPEPLRESPTGSVVEVSPASLSLMSDLARRVASHGGAALVIDYGRAVAKPEATLQAVRRHARADVLEAPGSVDLTAHVDFPLLARAAREAGAATQGPISQRDFLTALGIETRATLLKRNATAKQTTEIDAALHRLTDPEEMGTLFKVMAVAPSGFANLAGFPEDAA